MGERDAFERIVVALGAPMTIVTVRGDDEVDGCLVGFSTQCSIEPRRYLVCLSVRNRTYELARDTSTLVVHVLHDAEHDRALARLFGEETAHDTDKLRRCEWEAGPDGVPVLTGCDWFAGRIVDRVDLGDHVGHVLDVGRGSADRAGEPSLPDTKVRHLDPGNEAG
jgi:flavin reductase (DIM6/NTAB) family NADH-FMN oxidoreductase RutF